MNKSSTLMMLAIQFDGQSKAPAVQIAEQFWGLSPKQFADFKRRGKLNDFPEHHRGHVCLFDLANYIDERSREAVSG